MYAFIHGECLVDTMCRSECHFKQFIFLVFNKNISISSARWTTHRDSINLLVHDVIKVKFDELVIYSSSRNESSRQGRCRHGHDIVQ